MTDKKEIDRQFDALKEWCQQEFHRSRGEEWANGITHLAGVIFAVVALILMTVRAVRSGSAWCVASGLVYGITLCILTLSSTLYHLVSNYRIKWLFQVFDHCSIYLLIAGTYTPMTLIVMGRGAMGWSIFGIEWGLALVGILLETTLPAIARYVSLVIYLVMGWLCLINFSALYSNMPSPGLWCLVAGGISYTAGVIFYVMDHTPYMHTIWHLFVLGGIVCHWVSMAFYSF